MTDETLPKGALITVTMELALPSEATDEQVEAWLNMQMCHRGGIKHDNPLIDKSPEPFGAMGFDWQWEGYVGRVDRTYVGKTENGGERYTLRYHRERAARTTP